jgi:hypothetical protein
MMSARRIGLAAEGTTVHRAGAIDDEHHLHRLAPELSSSAGGYSISVK